LLKVRALLYHKNDNVELLKDENRKSVNHFTDLNQENNFIFDL